MLALSEVQWLCLELTLYHQIHMARSSSGSSYKSRTTNDVSFLELNRGLSGEGSGMFHGFENVASRGKMDEFALSDLIIV